MTSTARIIRMPTSRAHHPVLVLEVNGKPPAGWPKDSVEHKFDMGPYMISNPKFAAELQDSLACR